MTKSVHSELKILHLRLIDETYKALDGGDTLKAVVLVESLRVAADTADKARSWSVVSVEDDGEEEIVIHEEIPNA